MITREVRTGELIGHRVWFPRGITITDVGTLHSYNVQAAIWEPGKPMQGHPERPIVRYGRKPGIYAFLERDQLDRWLFYNPGVVIVGTAWLWGTVHQHERGVRAQYAYPREFDGIRGELPSYFKPDKILKNLRDRFIGRSVDYENLFPGIDR